MIQVKKDEMASAYSMNGEKRNVYRILVVKREGKIQPGRSSRICLYNIKMYLREDGEVWIGLMWLRVEANEGFFSTQ
jgi:hypothetical protein